ncbi:MAG: hypothetical protein IT376_13760 [Polyangiaceae bacterium]|nr:hypothetical protein [Polyangiaceae bacterium]
MAPRVVIEIDPQAERRVDVAITRRMVDLEMSEITLPPPPHAPRRRPALFVRVVGVREADAVRVELWERGDFYGSRTIRGASSLQLRARRAALAAAELARMLRSRRLREQERAQADRARREREAAEREARRPRVGGAALATGALTGGGHVALGPTLEGAAGVETLELRLRVAWLDEPASGTRPALDWRELAIAPRWYAARGGALRLAVGPTVAAAAVGFRSVQSVDGIAGQRETWSARAALGLELASAPAAPGWRVGAESGVVLRRMPVRSVDGSAARVGGVWVGVSVGATLGQ